MRVLTRPEVMISAAHTVFGEDGGLTDERTGKYISDLLVALHDWTLKLKG